MSASFVPFGPAHLAVIALTLLVSTGLVALARANPRLDRSLRWILAALLLSDWAAWLLILRQLGWLGVGNILPLNLCDWATVAAMITLVYPNQRSFELAYFWALGGTLPALLSPDVVYGFPDVRFLVFFAYHCIIIATVLYLTFVLRLRPQPASILRALMWTVAYFAVAGAADLLLGVNYGYIRAKPAGVTLLDALAPWPYYLPELVLLGTALMLVLYAPYFFADRLQARRVESQRIRP